MKAFEDGNKTSNFTRKAGDLALEDNIDNEIEILNFLTKRPASHLNARELRAAQNQISYLQNFEKQLKVLEDNDIINKYAGPISGEEDKHDKENENGTFDQFDDYMKQNQVIEASQEAEDDTEPKPISHKELASMIENLKAKALETVQ